ncbi:hypothetical protein [Treponema primitia]|uniref:hypothetical protein n=1 Tax=Treponema primitia TaxID=88058 RepID=UPI0002555770|nr:hypothetical protein [Treponema primitia]
MTFIRRLVLILLFVLPGVLFGNDLEDSRRAILAGILNERKIPFELRPLFTEYGGFGSSIYVSLPASPNGEEKKQGTFILAVPLSFTGDDGRNFPYAFEIALNFMDRILKTEPKTDILVAFLADEWSAPHNLGLRDLYSRLEVPEDTALIYLDMYGEISEMVIHHGARRELAPLNLLRPLGQLCDSRAIPYTLGISSNEIYKLALADGPPALEFALSRGLSALYLTGSNTASGGIVDLDTLLFDYANSIDIGIENPDYHYLIFQFAGNIFFIPEYTTVIFFLTIAALLFLAILIYSVVFRFRLVVQWKVFLKRSWILFLYYILLILSLRGAALVFQFMAGKANRAENFAPGTMLFYGTTVAQLLLGIALFTFISPLGNLIYVPRRANFYGNASVILVSLEILLSAFFDITFIPIFLWIFVFTFMAACIKKPLLVWLCGFLAFLLGFSTMLTIVRGGNRRLGSLILSGNTAIILYIALISLPFFITLKRGTLLLPSRDKKSTPSRLKLLVRMIPRLSFLVFTTVILGIGTSLFIRYPIKLPVQKIVDDTAGNTNVLGMNVKDRILLERRTLDITLEAPGKPLRFNLYLDGTIADEMPVIYAAPMPFRYIEDDGSPNRNSIEFVLGEGPPNPFITEIVVPLDFSGFLRAEALYSEQPGEDFQLRIIHRYPVGIASNPLP